MDKGNYNRASSASSVSRPCSTRNSSAVDSQFSYEAQSWTQEEERAVVSRLDMRIIPFVSLLQLLSFLDRVNVGNAKIANAESGSSMESELGITSTQYAMALVPSILPNQLQAIFFLGYVLFEIPSNLMLKRALPSRWISRIMGIISTCFAAVTGFEGMLVCRALLGAAEAGFFPGVVYYFSFWYTADEQALRVAIFLCAGALAGAFGGVLAFLISGMHGVLGLSGWRWIFIVEGIPSIVFGVVCWFYLPDFPYSASFLTPRQRVIATQRLQSNGASSVADATFNARECMYTIFNLRTWLFSAIYLGLMLPIYSFAFFLPTLISHMGLSSLTSQLLSAPPYIVTYVSTIAWAYHSDKTKDRLFHALIPFSLLSIGYTLLATTDLSLTLRYVLIVLTLTASFMVAPPFLAWHTSSIYGFTNTVKATSTAMVVSIGNLGGAIAPFLYSFEEETGGEGWISERRGHLVNAAVGAAACLMILVLDQYLKRVRTEQGNFEMHNISRKRVV